MRIAKFAIAAFVVGSLIHAAQPASAECADGVTRDQLVDLPESIRLLRPHLEDAARIAQQAKEKEHVRAAEFLMDWSDAFANDFQTMVDADIHLACDRLAKEEAQGYLSDFIGLTFLYRYSPTITRLRGQY